MRERLNRSSLRVVVVPFAIAFAVTVVACGEKKEDQPADTATTKAVPAASVAATPGATDTAGCGFVAKMAHNDPDSLLAEFLRRDGDGEFSQSSSWRDEAMACPGQAPGWDGFTLVASVASTPINKTADTARYLVTYKRAGLLEQDSTGYYVKTDVGEEKDTLSIGHSAFGWRIANWDQEPHLTAAGALKLPKLKDADRKKLMQIRK